MNYLLIIGIIFAFGYYLSLKVHPRTKCKNCNGTGERAGSAGMRYSLRKCPKCDGSGQMKRLGTRLFLREQ